MRGEFLRVEQVIGIEQGGLRPVLILEPKRIQSVPGTVIAMAIASPASKAGFPLTPELAESNLPNDHG